MVNGSKLLKDTHLEHVFPYRRDWAPLIVRRLFYDPTEGVFTEGHKGKRTTSTLPVTLLKVTHCRGRLVYGAAFKYQWVPTEPCEWLQLWLLPTQHCDDIPYGRIYVMYLMGITLKHTLKAFEKAKAEGDIRKMVWVVTPYLLYESDIEDIKWQGYNPYAEEKFSLLWSCDANPCDEDKNLIEKLAKFQWFRDCLEDHVAICFEHLGDIV